MFNYYDLDNVVSFSTKLIQDWDYADRQEYLDQVVETIKNTCDLYKYATRSDSLGRYDLEMAQSTPINTGDIKINVQDSIPLYTSYKLEKSNDTEEQVGEHDDREITNDNGEEGVDQLTDDNQKDANNAQNLSVNDEIDQSKEIEIDDDAPLFPNGVRSVKFEETKQVKGKVSYDDIRIVIKVCCLNRLFYSIILK